MSFYLLLPSLYLARLLLLGYSFPLLWVDLARQVVTIINVVNKTAFLCAFLNYKDVYICRLCLI